MLAKLATTGMDLSGNIVEVEYYGTNGLGNSKNESILTREIPVFRLYIDFFCMFDA